MYVQTNEARAANEVIAYTTLHFFAFLNTYILNKIISITSRFLDSLDFIKKNTFAVIDRMTNTIL